MSQKELFIKKLQKENISCEETYTIIKNIEHLDVSVIKCQNK